MTDQTDSAQARAEAYADAHNKLGWQARCDAYLAGAAEAEARIAALMALLTEARAVCNYTAFVAPDNTINDGSPLYLFARRVRGQIDYVLRPVSAAAPPVGHGDRPIGVTLRYVGCIVCGSESGMAYGCTCDHGLRCHDCHRAHQDAAPSPADKEDAHGTPA